jgi:hypothetical protein
MPTSNWTKAEKYGIFISLGSVVLTLLGIGCYVSSSFSEMRTEMKFAERLKEIEVKMNNFERMNDSRKD